MKHPRPPRPYTDYNIFFQLEREYILQNELGVTPNLDSSNLFNSSDANYNGPPLPPRYNGIILHKDWYKTGKGRNKKRRHRISHGKIGFCELSKKIATNWYDIDIETKKFCEAASDLGMIEYKKAMRLYDKKIREHTNNFKSFCPTPTKIVVGGGQNEKPKNDFNRFNDRVNTPERTSRKNMGFLTGIETDKEVIHISPDNISPTPKELKGDLVDMDDRKILQLWLSHHVENIEQDQSLVESEGRISFVVNLANPTQPFLPTAF